MIVRRLVSKLFSVVLSSTLLISISLTPLTTRAWADPGRPGPKPPAPAPAPAPAPGPIDTSRARAEGRSDGDADGGREGRERGPAEGRTEGERKGNQEGYAQCERDERRKFYDDGFRKGNFQGEIEGRDQGARQGAYEGERNGRIEGERDGQVRADRDASSAARPLGTQRGIDEANNSDATQKGNQDGTLRGDELAHQHALERDYPAGRTEYRNQKQAEPILNRDQFSQRVPEGGESAESTLAEIESLLTSDARESDQDASPDNRYYNPRRNYPTSEENQAYKSAYGDGYRSGFNSTYTSGYNGAYQGAYTAGYGAGCLRAKSQDYRADYQRGWDEGYRSGYDREYRREYDNAYASTYNQSFRYVSDQTYQAVYPNRYQFHYEDARQAAYRQRYSDLYDFAFAAAKTAKYNQVYPGYAQAERQRGRDDEAEDFRLRPARLLSAQVTETIANGVFEPGEALRLKLQFRNFATQALSGQDIRIQVSAVDPNLSVITQAEAVLRQGLRNQSVTDVTDALEFVMNESAAKRTTGFVVKAFYQGREIGTETVSVKSLFWVDVSYAEAPTLKEGIESPIRIRLKNNGNQATPANLAAAFRSDPKKLEITLGSVDVGILNAGETRDIEFRAIARVTGASARLPLLFETQLGSSRRVGLLDETREVPLINDYRIQVTSDATALRREGVVRVGYLISNISSRLTHRGMQLRATFEGTTPDNFSVMGPHPQYLIPLRNNESTAFVIPVLVRAANAGGTLVLEVQEDGRTVIVHRLEF